MQNLIFSQWEWYGNNPLICIIRFDPVYIQTLTLWCNLLLQPHSSRDLDLILSLAVGYACFTFDPMVFKLLHIGGLSTMLLTTHS